jgi:hypothetical protein
MDLTGSTWGLSWGHQKRSLRGPPHMNHIWRDPHSDLANHGHYMAKSMQRPRKVHFSLKENGHFCFPAGYRTGKYNSYSIPYGKLWFSSIFLYRAHLWSHPQRHCLVQYWWALDPISRGSHQNISRCFVPLWTLSSTQRCTTRRFSTSELHGAVLASRGFELRAARRNGGLGAYT